MPTVSCPKCSARLRVDDGLEPDDRIECTRCGKRFLPPQAEVTHRGKKVQRASGCVSVGGCLLIVLVCCGGGFGGWSLMKQKALDDLAAADRLFSEGKKGEAAGKYKTGYSFAPDDRKPEIVRRIVDHEASEGNAAEARRWIVTGLDAKLNITYETPAARDIHAQLQRERAEAEAKKQADAAKRKADEEERKKGIAVTAAQLARNMRRTRKRPTRSTRGR